MLSDNINYRAIKRSRHKSINNTKSQPTGAGFQFLSTLGSLYRKYPQKTIVTISASKIATSITTISPSYTTTLRSYE